MVQALAKRNHAHERTTASIVKQEAFCRSYKTFYIDSTQLTLLETNTMAPRDEAIAMSSPRSVLDGPAVFVSPEGGKPSILCPFSPGGGSQRRRRTTGRWSNDNSSSGSSSLSQTKLVVRFDECVNVKKFLPNWADPRVQEYEAEQLRERKSRSVQDDLYATLLHKQADHAELRRLDNCYLRIMKKHLKSSSATGSSFFTEDEWSPRGLEAHFDTDHVYARRKTKLQASLTVLLLQARKESMEEIARHYRTISIKSQVQAHRQGLLDELDSKHGLGSVVLTALKDRKRDKTTHSHKLKQTMQELEYLSVVPRKSQRFASLFADE